jgi:hypothetical protein
MQFLMTIRIDDSLPIEEQRLRAQAVVAACDQISEVEVDMNPSPYVNPFYYVNTLYGFATGGEGNPPDIGEDGCSEALG